MKTAQSPAYKPLPTIFQPSLAGFCADSTVPCLSQLLHCVAGPQTTLATVVKKPVSKAHIRSEMEKQISNFLREGGEVAEIASGISGRPSSYGPLKPDNAPFQEPKAERTYVPEVVAALEERKKAKSSSAKPKTNRRPRKKMIYDDFGEPLRWEWE
ncbi:hypothetical protein NO559_14850 [Dasania sp. GY-MA-18]|uniref:Transcriptional regulator SutA RNAP-binding domain-containing protein n=1 Tax=Dasania phycosphaerae TaxID=2950436 RepID=A0A9J6RQR1_9GAMM|nr:MULTISPECIES: hypothetical protein [Dasania]MCR8924060.1 hypothetical protein [Dasania sp. GY-MA-18]MCZ0866633.1 hypothetical protein [Dasania phycosphaerae]MCZ0870218.1 hypothetical protein [Dasania phycosphaerae]